MEDVLAVLAGTSAGFTVRALEGTFAESVLSDAVALDERVRVELGARYSHERWGEPQFLAPRPDKWRLSAAALAGGRLVGYAIASRSGTGVHIHRLAVDAAHRRQGVARRLVQHVERRARELGATRLTLSLAADNDPGAALFRSLGFAALAGEALRDYALRRRQELAGERAERVRAGGVEYTPLGKVLDEARVQTLNVLAIGAHLDDIELGCGGTLARAAMAGHCLRMICLSSSAYTNYDGTVLRTSEQALAEGAAASRALGCDDLEVLDFSTKDIPDDSRVVEALDRRITEFQPDIIFTHWPFDTHQAHRGTALATLSAARRQRTILMYDPVFPSGRSWVGFRPQVYVDIGDAIERKLDALRRHRSQYEKYGEQWIEGVRARARFRGYEMETTYAEAFEVVRMELKL